MEDLEMKESLDDLIEAKLQREEEKNHELLKKSESSIYVLDLQGNITYVNPAFMKLLEVGDPNELLDKPFLPQRFWHDRGDRDRFLDELKKDWNFGIKELALQTFKGNKLYVTVFGSVTKNVHGQVNGSQGILCDVTPKKELVLLKQTEEKLNSALDELKRFNRLAVGRELRMVELKREVNGLLEELNREERYPIISNVIKAGNCEN